MQKLINFLAFTSFIVSASVVGAGTYIYINKDTLIESAKQTAVDAIQQQMAGAFEAPALPIEPAATPAIPSVPFSF
jgi:hypothetical protein